MNRKEAVTITGNVSSELAHAEALTAIGVENATSLFAFDPPVSLDPAPGARYERLSPELLKELVGSDRRPQLPTQGKARCTNWTLSLKLKPTGNPLIAHDPHRTLSAP